MYFGQLERGSKCPTVDTLYKISKGLNISLSELLRFEKEIPSEIPRNEKIERIPDERVEQVIKILEDVTELFG